MMINMNIAFKFVQLFLFGTLLAKAKYDLRAVAQIT